MVGKELKGPLHRVLCIISQLKYPSHPPTSGGKYFVTGGTDRLVRVCVCVPGPPQLQVEIAGHEVGSLGPKMAGATIDCVYDQYGISSVCQQE